VIEPKGGKYIKPFGAVKKRKSPMSEYRIERDSMGEVKVPRDAMYGAQTQRAVDNFRISGTTFPRVFILALGHIKASAAEVNAGLGLLDRDLASAIVKAAGEVAEGRWDAHFPIEVFQTGSGTSTNMNANEVIAHRATELLKGARAHPNDHVNMGQSSNDVIPTAVHVSACLEAREILLPGLGALEEALRARAGETKGIIKTGRTHLMDAMPVTLGQEIGAWAHQVREGVERIEAVLPKLAKLAMGGTAVGTGINTHPEFARRVVALLSERTGMEFKESGDHFASQSSMDTAAELSGALKATATALMKIANDLRWMNSGPAAGLGEITLPALQPGSSIMPGKINPVICESVMMVCAQVMGNDLAVTVGNGLGNFQLNVMLPLIARNLLESITILGNASRALAEKAVRGFRVNLWRISELVEKNPVLVTALAPIIGYDRAAEIAKRAYAEGRRIRDVALEMTDLTGEELDRILDPRRLTEGGMEGRDR
jgi:fumarate hydratase class II